MRFEIGSCVDNSEEVNLLDPVQDDIIKTQCWVDIIERENKGRLYGAGKIGTSYKGGNGTLKQHSTSSCIKIKKFDNRRSNLNKNKTNHVREKIINMKILIPTIFS